MRTFITTLTLAALLGSGLAPPARSQTAFDPVAAERLRAAVSRQQSVGGDRYRDPVALDALVAPVALYPDALLDQILTAATYPDQVRAAGRILDDAPDLSRSELEDELAERDWDPSVLALLSDFPTVIGRMASDMTWTAQLGGAVIDQDDDVMAAVQRQRSRAYAAGNLVSGGPQVVTRSSDRIFIAPARPGTLYTPTYDPRVVYTIPNAPPPPPGSGTGLAPSPLVAGALAFGTALLIGELAKPDRHRRDDSDRRRREDNRDRRDPRDRPDDWRDRQVIYPGPDLRGFERVQDNRDGERRRDRAEEERQEARQARRREEARKEARDDRRKSERREEARKERRKADRAEEARQEKRREDRGEEARRDHRKSERSEEARKERREDRGRERKAERRPEGERPRAERRGEDDRRKANREARQPDRDRSESRGESRKKARKECREDDRECRRK